MYAYYTFYTGLIIFSILSFFLSIFVSPWYGLLGNIPLIIILSNRFQRFRVRCRAYPGFAQCKKTKAWCRAKAPDTQYDLITACKEKKTTVVGSAWSFFLNKRAPENPVFTYNFSSSKPEDGFWKYGTLLKTVTKYYEKKNQAFPSLPSYQNITLGAWIMTRSHGSSGDDGEPSSSRFLSIKYIDKTNNTKILLADWGTFKKIKINDIALILGVSFKQLPDNIFLHKTRVSYLNDWLSPGAYQRVCFIGKRRDVMIRWEKSVLNFDTRTYARRGNKKYFHKDPHLCSRFCLWFQADVCTVIYNRLFCACVEKKERYQSIVSLEEANTFVPQIYPIFTVFLHNQVNFEKIITDPTRNDIRDYYKKIKKFHKKYGGRTELRYGEYLFIDVSIPRRLVNDYIDNVFLENKGTYHLGKYQPPSKTTYTSVPGTDRKLIV